MDSQDIRMLLKGLKRYKTSKTELQNKLEILNTQATKITPTYGNKGGGGKSSTSKVENNVVKMQTIEESIRKLDLLIESAEKYLSHLKYYQRLFVEECVVNGLSYQEMAMQEDTTYENVKKIVDNSIKYLEKF